MAGEVEFAAGKTGRPLVSFLWASLFETEEILAYRAMSSMILPALVSLVFALAFLCFSYIQQTEVSAEAVMSSRNVFRISCALRIGT